MHLPDSDIPSRIIKENAYIFRDVLNSIFKNSIYQSEFSSIIKLADITLAFKKGDISSKESYKSRQHLSIFQTSQKSLIFVSSNF